MAQYALQEPISLPDGRELPVGSQVTLVSAGEHTFTIVHDDTGLELEIRYADARGMLASVGSSSGGKPAISQRRVDAAIAGVLPTRRQAAVSRERQNKLEREPVRWRERSEARQFEVDPRQHHHNIGVEIEVANYFVEVRQGDEWHPLRGTHDVVVKDDGYYELQAELSGKLEFVTDPPHAVKEDAPGNLQRAVRELSALAIELRAAIDAGGACSRLTALAQLEHAGDLVTDAKYAIGYREVGAPNLEFRGTFQATLGVPLAAIPKLFSTCAAIGTTNVTSATITAVGRWVEQVVTTHLGDFGDSPHGCISPELAGFLFVLRYYLYVGKGGVDDTVRTNLHPPKGQLDLMARTNFARMFKLVPERAWLTKEQFCELALGDMDPAPWVFNQIFDARPLPNGEELDLFGLGWPRELRPEEDTGPVTALFDDWDWEREPKIDAAYAFYIEGKSSLLTRKRRKRLARFDAGLRVLQARFSNRMSREHFTHALERLHRAGKPLEFLAFHPNHRTTVPVTRGAWLAAIFDGRDLLTQAETAVPILKTMGELDKTDDLGEQDPCDRGVIFELRAFSGEVAPEAWSPFVDRIIRYVGQVNAKMTERDRKMALRELSDLHRRAQTLQSKRCIEALRAAVTQCKFREQGWALVRRAEALVRADAKES
ncbi:hypothetical protein OV203_25855 [Nannocystis sp. ILAH1]|uniref:hypothetical protein n=1 Tax=unclassified Nannocystis TaxID=2627009 RepID=UPI002270A549|nr:MULTISPECIES: hypothetical protein [unclassified Nannocystis]MCY0990594.1 hypothetical protein [Nannocystis sp. ILAH1]MCY1072165.1 hypothetical protein [Nannocystis sp. RBIL2]